jgi:hypothetical protein
MQPQLQSIVASLESQRAHLHDLAAQVPAERWSKRADPNRWSVGECVVHLNLTSQAYLPLVRAALADAPAVQSSHSYRRDLTGFLLGYAVGPMPRSLRRTMRFRTTAGFVPKAQTPRDAAVADFDRLQSEIVALTRDCEGRAIDRIRINSPFNARAKYSVYSALVLLPRHQERHLIQADEVWPAR